MATTHLINITKVSNGFILEWRYQDMNRSCVSDLETFVFNDLKAIHEYLVGVGWDTDNTAALTETK